MSNEAPTDVLRLVPVEPTEAMVADGVKAAQRAEQTCVSWPEMALFTYRAMLAAAPASLLPGGGPHERWSILNHLGESWTPENFDTERQATAYLDSWKRDNPKMDLSKHKVIPVLVTMTAAPTGDA